MQSNEQAVERGGLRREIVRLPRRGTRSGDIHPEIGCQTWTRTKTNGLTDRRATLTPPGNGAAGRNSTCIVPLRRRMPHVFGHGSDLKLVSAAGFAPAVTRSQAGHVAATPRAVRPGVLGAHRGLCFMEIAGPTHLEPVSRGKNRNWRTRRELHPQPSRRQRVAPLIELRVQKWPAIRSPPAV